MQNESNITKFTAENCEKEPIHIPGAIQPHGILISLRSSDFTILQISENVFDHFGIHPVELLNQPLSQLMDLGPVEQASKRLGEKVPRLLNPIPIAIAINGQKLSYDGILHRSGRVIILELERHVPADEGYGGFGGFYEAIREVATKLMNSRTLDEALTSACEETRKLCGYSRVLIYKFDEDWNGTVISESRDTKLPSLLHHRFPSTDIPRQARELYLTNWLRIIPDANYQPSRILPAMNPITDRPLDLSNSVLRSVSPVHLEYMRNMGQAASMSISLIKDKKLWGLISCHNEVARFLKFESRVAAEFIGQMVSAQISARDESQETNHAGHLRLIFSGLLANTAGLDGAFETLKHFTPHLLGLAEARGVAICTPKEVYFAGQHPTEDQLAVLRSAIAQIGDQLYYTTETRSLGPLSSDFVKKAAGAMAITVRPGYEIVWFRPEMTEQIPWSGNPALSKEKSATGDLRPRKSFETWLENVEGRSAKWRQDEVDAAAMLLEGLQNLPAAKFSEEQASGVAFRSALAQSIRKTATTQSSREPEVEKPERVAAQLDMADKQQALLDGFSEFSMLLLNSEGRIQTWSAGATRLLGYNSKQTIGRTLDIFLSEDEAAKDKHQRVIDYVSEHNRCEEEMWLYRSDGSSFWGKVMVAAIRSKSSELLGFSIVIQDVTKEKAAEEELRATKVAAEAANEAKTAFLANISHEIRTPLGAVLGFAELIADKSASEEQRSKLLARIQKNGEQLTSLINDLLDLTKVEANKLTVELIEFDLAAALQDISDTLSIKAAEKSIELRFSVTGKLPRRIVSDPTRLRQILVNIVSNAIKFTPQGGEVNVVASLSSKATHRRILVTVEDSGSGMTQEQMARLFQPFAQADVSTTRKFGGTGLGLYVSQRLARLLGGDVSIVHSAPDRGSVFQISIDPGMPEEELTFDGLARFERPEPLNKLDNTELRGRKILVVDDSPDNRHLIQLYLEKSGASVVSAENGRQGIDLAFAGQYDLVLMDIQMPVLDGNAAMKELASRNYEVPVVALTAHAMAEERESSLLAGFRAYVTKPIRRDVLVRTIRELVQQT